MPALGLSDQSTHQSINLASINQSVGQSINPGSVGQPVSQPASQPAALTADQLARIACSKLAAQRRRAAKKASLSPEMLAIIATKREAALLRKAAKAAGQQRMQPVDLQSLVAIPSKDAPATTARHPSRKSSASRPNNVVAGHITWHWPDDQSISMFDYSHRLAGFWAIDTVNPNCWKSGAEYMEGSAADIILTQELKVPDGHLREQAEQTARSSKWSLAIEPCFVSQLEGHSAGTSVAVRSYIGMSESLVVKQSQHLHPVGHFCMRRVAAMGEGGVHCGTPYLYSMIGKGGILAQCNLDMLDSMAFTILGLVGPWIIGGDWNCTPRT